MNVLGVIFDSKLNWGPQLANAICKLRKALFALRLLRKIFNYQEMRLLLDSYFMLFLSKNCPLIMMTYMFPTSMVLT